MRLLTPREEDDKRQYGYSRNLRQRILHCQIVNRTCPLPLHLQEYVDLEYYLTRLASGSPALAPTMMRLRGE